MNQGKRLLIIDDDPDFVEGIRSILEAGHYEVDAAYNPKDGFHALETKHYDLLMLDIMMGRGAEGVMVAQKVAKDPKLKGMPVLIVTGIRELMAFLFPWESLDAHLMPGDEVLEKPIKPQLLLEKVSALLQQAEARTVRATQAN